MSFDPSQFHFIRPDWLFMLPVAVVLWLLFKRAARSSHWEDYIPKEMLAALQVNSVRQSAWWQWALLGMWLTLILAAAGPSWNKQPVPTVENQRAVVLLLDLSPSMLAEDVVPNRLTRAKYKLIDLIRKQRDGQIALIAYAGDAHTVSPLTDDPKTIEALLPALHPDIMPSRGSNVEAAVRLAQQLMKDAGAASGHLLLITDGVTSQASETLQKQMGSRHALSILAVGGAEAVPIPTATGGFMHKANGEIVLSAVNHAELNALASNLGGRFSSISADESDINHLLTGDLEKAESSDTLSITNSFDAWTDRGYFLVLLLLPLAVLFFRKGLIYIFPIFFLLPIDSDAIDLDSTVAEIAEPQGLAWADLWQTRDQQATQLLKQQRYLEAASKFARQDWSAIANYKNGDFAKAVSQLEGREDALSLYNKGNALAFKGDLEQAIKAYEQVLQQQPDHADAKHNKAVLEQLLQQQKNQSEPQQGESDGKPEDTQKDAQKDTQDPQSAGQEQPPQDSQQQPGETAPETRQSSEGQQGETPSPQAPKEPDPGQAEQEAGSEKDQGSEHQPDKQDRQGEEESAKQQGNEQQSDKAGNQQGKNALAEQGDKPLKDASEQWLRTIQHDPSGLLRRKFEHQAKQRTRQTQDTKTEDRY